MQPRGGGLGAEEGKSVRLEHHLAAKSAWPWRRTGAKSAVVTPAVSLSCSVDSPTHLRRPSALQGQKTWYQLQPGGPPAHVLGD